jgi:hypothetical protein
LVVLIVLFFLGVVVIHGADSFPAPDGLFEIGIGQVPVRTLPRFALRRTISPS